jgi:hypothetical protein
VRRFFDPDILGEWREVTSMNLSDLWAGKANQDAPVSAEADSTTLVDQIRRLGELRDQGLLSAEQFRVRRAQLLGRPA